MAETRPSGIAAGGTGGIAPSPGGTAAAAGTRRGWIAGGLTAEGSVGAMAAAAGTSCATFAHLFGHAAAGATTGA